MAIILFDQKIGHWCWQNLSCEKSFPLLFFFDFFFLLCGTTVFWWKRIRASQGFLGEEFFLVNSSSLGVDGVWWCGVVESAGVSQTIFAVWWQNKQESTHFSNVSFIISQRGT
jgi:hypothetical protein